MKSSKSAAEDAKRLLSGENEPKPQIVTITESPSLVEATKLVVRRQTSANSLPVDPLAPRRLSQLFVPLQQDELESDEIKTDETSSLLDEETNGTPPPRHVDPSNKPAQNSESVNKVDKESDSDIESNTSSKSGHPSDSNSDDEDEKVPSMGDTICSNRSSYFKYYYFGSKGGEDSKSRNSTRASSLTSLASLIKERKSSMVPKKHKKNTRDDISLIVLVVVLFLVLVIGISLIYYFYYKHLLQLSLFKRLKFNEEERLLELFDSNGSLDIAAKMGNNLPPYSKPEECTDYLKYIYSKKEAFTVEEPLPEWINNTTSPTLSKTSMHEFQFDNETVCLDWIHHARVQIHNAHSYESVSCYNVFWLSHLAGVDLQDCFHISSNEGGVWWGIGELSDGGYPLENVHNLPATRFLSNEGESGLWGKILRRVFVSSNGGIITLPDHLPARIEILDKMLCISANASDFVNAHLTLTLNYTLCSSPNMSSTVGYLNFLAQDPKQNALEDYESNLDEILVRIANPIWIPYLENLTSLSQDSVLKYVESIQYRNKKIIGKVLLPLYWQEKIGHFTFDETRFPDIENLTAALANLGFQLALTISPIVATDTDAFEEGVREGYWVNQKDSQLPMLLKSEGVSAAALTDFTNPRASEWFIAQIENIKTKYGISHFHLSAPGSNSISVYHEFQSKIPTPDLYFQSYLKALNAVATPLATDAAIVPPFLPTFVTMGNLKSDWHSLETLVPRMLTLSMLGYPLIDSGPIGGTTNKIPEDELYIRWVQVAAFFPVFQVNVVPSMYSKNTRKIVEKFIKLRRDIVIPRLHSTINNTLIDKHPLISPLGIIYPHDLDAAAVSDEWIIGEDLLVAPVLRENGRHRDIYIPEGLWESQSDGRLKKGPGWMQNYEVPLTEVAYFFKRYSITLSG